jgi:hypothetical protein
LLGLASLQTRTGHAFPEATNHQPSMEDVMKTIKQQISLVMLALLILSGFVHAESVSTQFVPFKQFFKESSMADPAVYLSRPGSRANNVSFEQMRRHILLLYQDVDVSHSFMRDSDYFDCVPIEQQASVRLLHLKELATPPPMLSPPSASPFSEGSQTTNSMAASPQLRRDDQLDEFGNSMKCEEHTIPMRRVTLDELSRFQTLEEFFEKGPNGAGHPVPSGQPPALATPTHKYAYTYQAVNNWGGNSALNNWNPTVTSSLGEVFSLSQQWYAGGSGSALQTVEGGWQVYPQKYGTTNAVLFIYWTATGYQGTGCYNLDCPAFVQTNSNWDLGSRFVYYSTLGGAQADIQMQWRLYAGNWWLYLQGQAVGYYPGSIYRGGQLTHNATLIEYGGETVGSTLWPPMGSGRFASGGWQHAAYQRNVFYFNTASSTQWAHLTAAQPSPTCYTVAGPYWSTTSGWGAYFYLGGPGGSSC